MAHKYPATWAKMDCNDARGLPRSNTMERVIGHLKISRTMARRHHQHVNGSGGIKVPA